MKTPSPREMMGLMGRIEQAKKGSVRLARPSDTYRPARRTLAKQIARMMKKGGMPHA